MDLSELKWVRNKKDIRIPRIVRILIPKKKLSGHSGTSNECDVIVAHTQNELKKKKKKKKPQENKGDST